MATMPKVISRGAEPHLHTRPHILSDSIVPVPSAPLKDSNVAAYEPLVSPALLIHEFPLTPASRRTIESTRQGAARIIQRDGDDRLVVIVGPCSIHDADVAREYAQRLQAAIQEHGWDRDLLIVMRAYLEKPRTTVGWKGFLYDPNIDSSNQVNRGLKVARQLLLDITALGLPVACEVLDTISPQFVADLYSWGAVGARTTESQVHRQLVSGLSFPIGFKNGSSGNINIALDGMQSAASPHSFLGVTEQGLAAIVHTKGNPNLHVIHRGGDSGPNFDEAAVASTVKAYPKNRKPSIMIDASHGNSQKDYRNQPKVIAAVADQIRAGEQAITGVMIESNINEGKQAAPNSEEEVSQLKYGVSITDGCVNFETTVQMLETLSQAVKERRAAACQSCENQPTCNEDSRREKW
ncbi:3-deoxy-7-phosphoheptulonate synthase [Aspergillus clavatus NRRL 1]|uniref:Phospho-2-dehydro-3-deoxyheptonate aldolase n=1 Tax=Aspergillus clavatus (strain ATCC 1007 / CBS 513.65 / DSM 816 / NCTC 3887 / NRRL 1 / QM 1276 / 107) TaxID=344612 RepID=A1CCF4_ASPCL|nr:phospho-2-dehydro-3-deoxyheptonate aldolase [Aspergillus clavatus NRRL 1]EAW12211.1 phospho-2-dehydro-3-deoxyheptonate aldolase [Aspergillus clavatus NRRL 1]